MKKNTYLVAIKDVEDFTIIDDDANELTFSLKEGSRVKIHQWVGTDYDEIWVRLFSDDEEPCCVMTSEFKIEECEG